MSATGPAPATSCPSLAPSSPTHTSAGIAPSPPSWCSTSSASCCSS
uniref:Uncharacterized protein n=1 Tax=Arundo donax TaxID=35708 RepID=A0A0A8ZMS5_ARUDO